MQIDYALILAAGMGTRMGEIGKKKPKPLWPIFNKTLLELQIRFCRELGVKKIYINSFFLAGEIAAFLRDHKELGDVVLLVEDPLLDSGGAIHNLASRGEVGYSGNLLMVNADQFLFFDKKLYIDALNSLESSRAALFGIKVPADSKYNETILDIGRLTAISKPSGKTDFVTYSGLGVLKLDGLSPVAGISKFFETVANYKNERIDMIVPDHFEYWDFGTAEIYFKSIKKISQDNDSGLKTAVLEFLSRNKVDIDGGGNFFNSKLNSIDLDFSGNFIKNSIHWNKMIQKLGE